MIRVIEHKQAGDIWLIKFICSSCNEQQLSGWNYMKCNNCNIVFNGPFDFENSKFYLLCGTDRKRKAGLSKKKIIELRDMQENRCAYCCTPFDGYMEVEHIIPLSVGGTNKIENICLSCRRCNAIAGSFYFKDFIHKRDYILKNR